MDDLELTLKVVVIGRSPHPPILVFIPQWSAIWPWVTPGSLELTFGIREDLSSFTKFHFHTTIYKGLNPIWPWMTPSQHRVRHERRGKGRTDRHIQTDVAYGWPLWLPWTDLQLVFNFLFFTVFLHSFAGLLYDLTASFTISFYVLGGVCSLIAISLACEDLWRAIRGSRKEEGTQAAREMPVLL